MKKKIDISDRPANELTAKVLLNSVGVKVKKTMAGIKFIYKPEVIDDLKQLGFSIDVLKVRGGEMPLPVLRKHIDEQASLEAYWSAQAEDARYRLSVAQDSFNYWFEQMYAKCFSELQNRGIPKPTQVEVNARISLRHREKLEAKKLKLRKLERTYRILQNCCYTSIATKGRMLQTLRNVIQGGVYKAPAVENEVIGTDITNLKVSGGDNDG